MKCGAESLAVIVIRGCAMAIAFLLAVLLFGASAFWSPGARQ